MTLRLLIGPVATVIDQEGFGRWLKSVCVPPCNKGGKYLLVLGCQGAFL